MPKKLMVLLQKGLNYCTKASKFLEAKGIEISETVPASKKLQAEDADLLKTGTKLIAMKGKKVTEYDTSKNLPSEAIEAMLGPTGNL